MKFSDFGIDFRQPKYSTTNTRSQEDAILNVPCCPASWPRKYASVTPCCCRCCGDCGSSSCSRIKLCCGRSDRCDSGNNPTVTVQPFCETSSWRPVIDEALPGDDRSPTIPAVLPRAQRDALGQAVVTICSRLRHGFVKVGGGGGGPHHRFGMPINRLRPPGSLYAWHSALSSHTLYK